MHRQVILILSVAVVCGCSPLRNVQTERQVEMTISDTTLARLLRREVERSLASLRQTVVEYYPPTAEMLPEDAEQPDTLPNVLQPPKIPPRQTVRRVILTEATMQKDRTTHTDSISHSRINTAARTEEHSATEESPNTTGVVWIKWFAASLALLLLLLLLLLIKLR